MYSRFALPVKANRPYILIAVKADSQIRPQSCLNRNWQKQ